MNDDNMPPAAAEGDAANSHNGDDEDSKPASATAADIPHTATLMEGLISPVLPPSSSHDEHEDDDDDWSRQVETDETTTGHLLHEDSFRLTESVIVEEQQTEPETATGGGGTSRPVIPQPTSQRELTLKEKLVMRERERRIETERARLKRQFALNNVNNHPPAGDETSSSNEHHHHHHHASGEAAPASGAAHHHHHASHEAGAIAGGGPASRESESVAETLGEESIVAHPDEESSANEGRLGFNMERFLRNSDTFNPQLETTDEGSELKDAPNVLMKRFLNEPVVVPSSTDHQHPQQQPNRTDVARSVSFEMDGSTPTAAVTPRGGGSGGPTTSSGATGGATSGAGDAESGALSSSRQQVISTAAMASFGDDSVGATDTSVVVQADTDDIARDPLSTEAEDMDVLPGGSSDVPSSTASAGDEQPRVLRLTEADMQEMAAIEDASIGNAPPSEREEMLSEIGEMADFSSSHLHGATDGVGNFSLDTPTTAMESGSQISGTQIGVPQEESVGQRSMDGLDVPTLSSGLVLGSSSPRGSANDTVEANPPSETAREEVTTPMLVGDDDDHVVVGAAGLHNRVVNQHVLANVQQPILMEDGDAVIPSAAAAMMTANVVEDTNEDAFPDNNSSGSHAKPGVVVDGFDFDKNAPTSPLPVDNDDSYRALPMDHEWSPAGKMGLSPLVQPRSPVIIPPIPTEATTYGATAMGVVGGGRVNTSGSQGLPLMPQPQLREMEDRVGGVGETQPLLSDVPSEIIATRQHTEEDEKQEAEIPSTPDKGGSSKNAEQRKLRSMKSVFRHAISDVRSEDESDKEAVNRDAELYAMSSMFQRAVPERLVALLVTLLFEIPVLLMISGGSDALCALIGRSRYQLLIAFLPLTSAISGNVGLQASTLTTRAISHNQVTALTYGSWLLTEVGAACFLALGMGMILGSIAFVASGMDFAFGVTILIAQFVSILTAGFTGTLAPVIFTFVFKRDSGKWGGPLETAVQDIVGSFAMVILSYYVLAWLGPGPIDPNDVCGVVMDDDSV